MVLDQHHLDGDVGDTGGGVPDDIAVAAVSFSNGVAYMVGGMTEEEKRDLRQWHEGVIAKYPETIQRELRDAMTKWLAGVKSKPRTAP